MAAKKTDRIYRNAVIQQKSSLDEQYYLKVYDAIAFFYVKNKSILDQPKNHSITVKLD